MMTATIVLHFLFHQTTQNSILVHATTKIHYHLLSQSIYNCLRRMLLLLLLLVEFILCVNRQRCRFFHFYIFFADKCNICVFCENSKHQKSHMNENYMFVVSIHSRVECGRHFINSMLQVWI